VVFLHGGPGIADLAGGAAYFGQLTGDGYDVFIYDRVGTGRSNRLQDPRGSAIAREVADLEAIRQQIRADRLVLIGHSWADPWPALAGLATPALVLKGSCDYLSWGTAIDYRHALPQARLVYLHHAGHNAYRDQPARFLAVVRAFLTGRPSPFRPGPATTSQPTTRGRPRAPMATDRRVEDQRLAVDAAARPEPSPLPDCSGRWRPGSGVRGVLGAVGPSGQEPASPDGGATRELPASPASAALLRYLPAVPAFDELPR
jgi:hypothetical protein